MTWIGQGNRLPLRRPVPPAPALPPGRLPGVQRSFRSSVLTLLVTALATASVLGACGSEAPSPGAAAPSDKATHTAAAGGGAASEAAPPPALPTTSGETSPLDEPEGFLGVVVAREAVDVSAEITGRLDRVTVRVGDRVRRGDVLAVLDTSLLRQDLAMAEAALRASRAEVSRSRSQLHEAQTRYERRSALPDTFSKEELAAAALENDTAQAAFDAAEARAAEQEVRIEQLRESIGRAEIRAPFDGTVALRYLDPGATVLAGAPVVNLLSTGDLLVRFAVPPEEVGSLSVGQTVEVEVEGLGHPTRGTILRISPEIDGPSRMVFAEAHLEALETLDEELRTGLVARVRPG